MSRQKSAFERVRDLCSSLRSESKITERRKVGDQLHTLLSDPRYQARLARETGYDFRKICSVWRLAISNSIIAAQRTMDGKPKVTAQDVLLPWKIMTLADKDSSQFHHGIFGDLVDRGGGSGGGRTGVGGAAGPSAASAGVLGSGAITSLADQRSKTKFSAGEIQKLLQFCLHALGDDSVREVAEADLLGMLLSLCSRPDYVTHFHIEKDVEYILSEVERRLVGSQGTGGRQPSGNWLRVVDNSSKVFANLICQLTISLSVGMHMQLAPCFALIIRWCRSASSLKQSQAANEKCMPFMYSAATNLLLTHSEQCVPLMKQHGRHLLALAKKSFPYSTGQTRDALVDYLSAHIVVCEVAGRMQGLLPGDLGDLGRASLSSSQIETLLTLIVSQKQLEQSIFPESSMRSDNAASRKRKRHSVGGRYRKGVEWVPLSRRQRRHLELCARLMYSAQRYWVARTEVAATDKLDDMVDDGCFATREDLASDSFDSPFVSFIASRLCGDRFLPAAQDIPASTGSLTFTQSGRLHTSTDARNATEALETLVCDSASLPMIASIATASQSGSGRYAAAPSSTLAYLRLLSACADTYPSGACWSVGSRWREDQDVNVALTERRYEKIASPTETASVVFIVLTTLITSGGSTGDHDVQMWAVLCLLKLTQPSFRAFRYAKATRKASRLLTEIWGDVYNTLFRSDLKYASYTSSAFEGSLGEMVLMLLTEIVSLRLTDPSLPIALSLPRASSKSSRTITTSDLGASNQSTVWSLPVFRDAKSVQSSAPFELISQILRHVGLSDHGPDTIDRAAVANVDTLMEAHDLQGSPETHHSTLSTGRRYRLMAYCLRFIQEAMHLGADETQRKILPLACECLSVLIGRNQTNFPTSFAFGRTYMYNVVETPNTWGVHENSVSGDDALAALWKDQLFPLRLHDLAEDVNGSFSVGLRQSSFCCLSACREGRQDDGVDVLQKSLSQNANAVSPLLSKALRVTSIDYLRRCATQTLESSQLYENDDDDPSGGSSNGKDGYFPIITTKVLISIALADEDARRCSDNLDRIRDDITMSVRAALELLPEQSNQHFDTTVIDLLGIFRALLCLSSSGCSSIIPIYGASAKLFYEYCYHYLELYAIRSDDVMIAASSPTSQGRGATATLSTRFDSDSEDEGLVFGESNNGDRPESRASNNDSEDSDDEYLQPSGDKRRKTVGRAGAIGLSVPVPRNSHLGKKSNPTHATGAWLCADVMTVLDPSLECYKSVTDCLVWPDNLDHDAKTGKMYTVDRTDALVCLSLFVRSDALLRAKITKGKEGTTLEDEGGDETVLSICADIIETIRSTADTSSMLHLCGFSTAASLIQSGSASGVPDRDIDALLDILHPDGRKLGDKDSLKRARRTLKRRPRVKVQQMQAVVSAFLNGGEHFHSVFDGCYAPAFVIPAVCHIDSHVRETGIQAIAAALKVLPNQRPIVNSVVRLLAPLPFKGDFAKEFDRWLKQRFGYTENENPKDWRAFHDAQESLESYSIRCRGVIAACTSDENIVRENILYLVRLSFERPDLLMPCYRACEQAAVSRGYRKLDDLFSQEREWLLQEFLVLGIQLHEIPLLVSSPRTVRFLLRIVPSRSLPWQQPQQQEQMGTAGNTEQVSSLAPLESSSAVDLDGLEQDRASQYAQANASSLIPLIVLESSKFKEESEEDEVEPGWSQSAFQYAEDAANVLVGGKSDGDISILMKTHLEDIYALFVPILHDSDGGGSETYMYQDEEEEEERQSTRDLIRKKAGYSLDCLKLVISEEITNRHAAKVCHLIVREILRLKGRQVFFGKHCLPSSCFFSAIKHVAENLSTSKEKDKGLFESAGSSVTECMLDSKRWLDESVTQAQIMNSWKVVECVCDQSCEEIEKTKDQMGFVIHVLLGILLESRYEKLRPSVLSKLREITSATMSENSVVDWSDAEAASLNELVLALFHVHEECMKELLMKCLDDWKQEQKERRRSMGLLSHRKNNESGDIWGWDEDCRTDAEESLTLSMGLNEMSAALANGDSGPYSDNIETMVKVYDLIEFLLLKSPAMADPALTKLDPLPVPSLEQNEMRALSKVNYKYSLEALVLRFDERQGGSKKELSSSDAESELKRFLSFFHRHRYASAESGTLNMHLRSLVAGLVRLENIIRISLRGKDVSEISYGPLLYKTIQGLFAACHSNYPNDVRLAASRCIGELNTFDLTSFRSLAVEDDMDGEQPGDHRGHTNPFIAMQLGVLRLLANYFKSSNSDTAIIAKDTSKWVLRTREGLKSWKRIENTDTKRVLEPLLMANKRFPKSDGPGLDEKFREQLYHKSGGDGESDKRNGSEAWCWREKLWMCLDGGDKSYEGWIKDLVCAIIVCCYGREGRKQSPSDAKSSQGDDKSAYFQCLLRMCAREADFAATVFPGIIFDLLSSDVGKEKSRSKDSVRSEVAVGVSDSKMNCVLTRCFSYLISPSASALETTQVRQIKNIETNTEALCLAVDTLDSLRRVVQSRWLASSSHKRNITEFPAKKGDSGKKPAKRKRSSAARDGTGDSQYTADLPTTPEWNGVPFGIVLHLPGLAVASACLRANRFASALFYSEMFADNHLGGSGGVLERLAREKEFLSRNGAASFDISGFGQQTDDDSIANDKVALSLSGITMTCLAKFGDSDGLEGVQTLDTAIRFYHDAENASSLQSDEATASSDWESLLALDTRQQMTQGSNNSSNPVAVTTRLKNIGLRHVLRNYMLGLQGHVQGQSQGQGHTLASQTQEKLKDQWFEESWRALQWDDSLLSSNADAVATAFTAGAHSRGLSESAVAGRGHFGPESAWIDNAMSRQGMNESIHHAFNSALNEEPEAYLKYVSEARRALLDEMCSTVGNESLVGALPDFSTKLKALNQLQDMEAFFDKMQPTSRMVTLLQHDQREGKTRNEVPGPNFLSSSLNDRFPPHVGFLSQEFLMSIREVALRVCYQKRPDDADSIGCAIADHLLGFSVLARQRGRPEAAGACLARLSRLLDTCGPCFGTSTSNSLLRLHLEGAKLNGAKGNFSAAIRTGKLVLTRLQGLAASDEQNCLISDAAALCGELMVEYKVESGKNILEDYLRPASKSALRIYNNNNSTENGLRASQSEFALAEFVSSLYENVQKKISSQEWINAGVASDERRAELQLCNKMLEKANKENSKGKTQRNRSGQTAQSKKQTEEKTKKEYRELMSHVATLRRELKMDEKERTAVEKSGSEYLKLALRSYGNALSIFNASTMPGDVSTHIFRVISLWFSNSTSSDVNNLMREYQATVPTHHFVPLAYQIFARIDEAESDSGASDFQSTLRSLILKMCKEHPYHCLMQLIALANGNKVDADGGPGRSNAYLQYNSTKSDASSSILNSLRQLSGPFEYVSNLVDSSTAIATAYIDLAMYPTTNFHEKKHPQKKIALSVIKTGGAGGIRGGRSKVSLDKILGSAGRKVFKNVPCILTKPPMLRPDHDYGGGVSDPVGSELIDTFDPNFAITDTGIHRPKIVKCRGSRGGIFKQLVKGEDDIRQDAIMQQVFSTVNNLLRRPFSASMVPSQDKSRSPQEQFSRRLNVVTYNIIPLSPVSGVLEWVDNTMPFGEYLNDRGRSKDGKDAVDRVGAHSRYYPGEWGTKLCQTYFMDAPDQSKRQAFDEICKRFSPAFRYFFVERFSHSLQAWHVARTMYTRSCAVNSIVGHILGIGDRHCNNILVHQKTGEVVHIDFGIVFEQGKCLNTPETVPFRLTRDIVDGMGTSGTEGCFSLAAEATASVLRGNTEALLTILSAVVSDPLYKWSINPLQARQIQRSNQHDNNEGDESGDVVDDAAARAAIGRSSSGNIIAPNEQSQNEAANRAIQKIRQKLLGYEEGNSGERQSVEGQVQLLINSARDPDNLCMLYHGWAPWI